MLLLVDAGNTRTKIGLFDETPCKATGLPECDRDWVLENSEAAPWGEISDVIGSRAGLSLCITGSNPERVSELAASLPKGWPAPTSLPPRSEFPLQIDVDHPERVGIDRLLNAIAANRLRRPGQAAVVISSGTATTIDYVAPDGRYCGGAILPGFELSARALHQYTSLLPLIPLDVVLSEPPEELGRNTEAAMRSGLYWGHVGAVRELLRRLLHRGAIEQESASAPSPTTHLGNLAADETPLVLLTGGAAPLLSPHLPSFTRVEPHLPLQGLAILMRR